MQETMSAALQRYKTEIDLRDWTYDYSDDPAVSRRGREHDALLRSLYSQMSPEDKERAAVYCYDHAPQMFKEAYAAETLATFKGI